jgi:hypothetical protein
MPSVAANTDLSADVSAMIDTDDTREEREICRIGEEALEAVRQTFDRWMQVACALDIGRQKAMIATGADDVQDRTYRKAFSRWLARHPKFNNQEELPDSTRSWLLRCYDYQGDIISWRHRQGAKEMIRYNYPETVFLRWAKAEPPDLLTAAQREKKPRTSRKEATDEIKDATARLKEATDDLEARRAKQFDLSPARIDDSIENFTEVYGKEQALRFAGRILHGPLSDTPEVPAAEPTQDRVDEADWPALDLDSYEGLSLAWLKMTQAYGSRE